MHRYLNKITRLFVIILISLGGELVATAQITDPVGYESSYFVEKVYNHKIKDYETYKTIKKLSDFVLTEKGIFFRKGDAPKALFNWWAFVGNSRDRYDTYADQRNQKIVFDKKKKELYYYWSGDEKLDKFLNLTVYKGLKEDNALIEKYNVIDTPLHRIDTSAANSAAVKGWEEMKKENYWSATQAFAEAIKNNPYGYLYYYYRGLAEANNLEHGAAMEDFDIALSIMPDDPNVYYSRGNLYDELGFLHKAISDYNVSVMLDSTNQEYLMARGTARLDMGLYPLALQDMDKILKMNPGNSAAWYCKGVTNEFMLDYPAALDNFERARKTNEDPERYKAILRHQGLMQVYLNRREEGCINLAKARELGLKDAADDWDKYCK